MKKRTYSAKSLVVEQLEARCVLSVANPIPPSDSDLPDSGQTFYVSTTGSDSDLGTTVETAFQTINAAADHVSPGDTVLVMPGLYPEEIYNFPGGTSWEQPVRIAAYDPDDRPVLRPNEGSNRVFTFAAADTQFIEVDGLVMDASNVIHEAIKITWSVEGTSHHIRIKNSEIANSSITGIYVKGHNRGVVSNEFINLDIHSNGRTRHDHGIYISTSYNTVENSRIYNNAGWGITNYADQPNYNIYRNNVIFDNNTVQQDGVGLGIHTGTGIEAYGNKVWGHNVGIAVTYGATDVVVRDNESFNNELWGLRARESTNVQFLNNTVYGNKFDLGITSDSHVSVAIVSALPSEEVNDELSRPAIVNMQPGNEPLDAFWEYPVPMPESHLETAQAVDSLMSSYSPEDDSELDSLEALTPPAETDAHTNAGQIESSEAMAAAYTRLDAPLQTLHASPESLDLATDFDPDLADTELPGNLTL